MATDFSCGDGDVMACSGVMECNENTTFFDTFCVKRACAASLRASTSTSKLD